MFNRTAFKLWAIMILALTTGSFLIGEKAAAQSPQALFDSTWYGFNSGTYTNGRYPVAARMADVDNDGDPDVVVAKRIFSKGFTLLKNEGDGIFAQAELYPSPEPTEDVETADFDQDGWIDVVVANYGQNGFATSISLFLNQGNGSFGIAQNYTVQQGPTGLAAADFDTDGYPDLAVANYGYLGQGDSLSLLMNDGHGGFQPAINFFAGNSPYKVVAEYIDGDTLIDLVVANENQRVNVLFNSGDNDFSNRTEYNVLSQWASDFYPNVVVADMDNDNDNDILYSSTRTWDGNRGLVALLPNLGNGTFASAQSIPLTDFTAGAVDLAVGDFNNDSWLDIVGASFDGRTSDGYQVVMSDGAGNFLPAYRNPGGQATRVVMTADVDLDGDTDILTGDGYTAEITVHPNYGNATFPTPELYPTTPISGAMDAADIDLDGDLDVVTSATGVAAIGVHVAVLKNNGNGSFAPYQTYSIRSGGVQAKFRKLDGDNYPDLLFATSRSSPPYDFHTAINQGDGTFGPVQTWPVGACGWSDIDAFDLDNDNDLDVVITEWLGCPGVPNSARRIFISLNNGDGTFASPYEKVVNPFPSTVAGADLNDDGNIDLVTGHSQSIDVHLGLGNGDFQTPVSYPVMQNPYDIEIVDLNSDGTLDLASANDGDSAAMSVLVGNGNGSFQLSQNYSGATSPDLRNVFGITAGDLDNDGDVDLVVGNQASNDLSFYSNLGNGTFEYRMRYGVYYGASSPIYDDFDGDGQGDIAAVVEVPPSGIDGAVAVIHGRATGPTRVVESDPIPPNKFTLFPNYPNPFNPQTTIAYNLPHRGLVRVKVYDLTGKFIVSLVNEVEREGFHEVVWDGKTKSGTAVSSGIYFARVSFEKTVLTRKMTLMK